MKNKLWEELHNPSVFKLAWQLVRKDCRDNFIEEWFTMDAFAYDLHSNISDLINRIKSESYIPQKLLPVEVPKGSYGFRPGSIVPIRDHVVLYAIVTLIAKILDETLTDSVYSWRVKVDRKSGDTLFRESDVLDIPFLKRSTIQSKLDPFDPWYILWPEFDALSKQTLKGPNPYRYMVTSDIAAYFENIQLPILRDHLISYFHDDQKIINLLLEILESWAVRTTTGRYIHRGIPQGNEITSFLGNIFLLPLDEVFSNMKTSRDIIYYRYMDDIRIFTNRLEDARHVIFMMDRTLRKLHLNVQTAKTKIYDEVFGEVSAALFDARQAHLTVILDDIRDKKKSDQLTTLEKSRISTILDKIAETTPTNKSLQVIKGSRKPFTGLSLRTFRMWVSAKKAIDDHDYIDKLLNETFKNADYRLTMRIKSITRELPSYRSIENKVLKHIKSPRNIFPHQEAELIRALRYLSQIHIDLVDHCRDRLFTTSNEYYVRMQAAYLISRIEVNDSEIGEYRQLFESEENIHIKTAIAGILCQEKDESNSEFVRSLVFHPNEYIQAVGKLFRWIKNDTAIASEKMKFIFNEDVKWRLCDNMSFLHLLKNANKVQILDELIGYLKELKYNTLIGGLRPILRNISSTSKARQKLLLERGN